MLKILVVDDELPICESMRCLVEDAGFIVDTAVSAKEALDLFSPGEYSIVLLDLFLGFNIDQGMDLARELRAQDPDVVIVVVTGYDLPMDHRLMESVNATVQKPIDANLMRSDLFLWATQYHRLSSIRHYNEAIVDDRMRQIEENCAEITEIGRQLEALRPLLLRINNGCWCEGNLNGESKNGFCE